MEGYSYLLDLAIILLSTKVLGLATDATGRGSTIGRIAVRTGGIGMDHRDQLYS